MSEFELWRGGVETWECDEMGHMNVRFYLTRAAEGLGVLAAQIGMIDAFSARAASTLLVREQHVRFLREAAAGAALEMTGGVLSIDETGAEVLQVLRHSGSNEPCASIVSRVEHVRTDDGRPFGWSERLRVAAEAVRVERPAFAEPRGVPAGPVDPTASVARADDLGLLRTARGMLMPADCDVFGRMRPDTVMHMLWQGARHIFALDGDDGLGRVMLEIRMLHLAQARAGAQLLLRSGFKDADEKTERVVHWLLDPVTGEPWASAEAVVARFDLATRRIAVMSEATQAAQTARLTPGLAL